MIKDVAIEQVVKERIKPCPECGQPKTDEAVDMVMERLEALYEET